MPKSQYSKWAAYLENITRVKEIEQRHLCDVFSELRSFVFVYTRKLEWLH